MATCYRMQEKGIEFEDMRTWRSTNWGTMELLEGIAACIDEHSLRWLAREWYGSNLPADQEVVIFSGIPERDLGDGWIVTPQYEIDRIDLIEFVGDVTFGPRKG
jgi:hypothetical protein